GEFSRLLFRSALSGGTVTWPIVIGLPANVASESALNTSDAGLNSRLIPYGVLYSCKPIRATIGRSTKNPLSSKCALTLTLSNLCFAFINYSPLLFQSGIAQQRQPHGSPGKS